MPNSQRHQPTLDIARMQTISTLLFPSSNNTQQQTDPAPATTRATTSWSCLPGRARLRNAKAAAPCSISTRCRRVAFKMHVRWRKAAARAFITLLFPFPSFSLKISHLLLAFTHPPLQQPPQSQPSYPSKNTNKHNPKNRRCLPRANRPRNGSPPGSEARRTCFDPWRSVRRA